VTDKLQAYQHYCESTYVNNEEVHSRKEEQLK